MLGNRSIEHSSGIWDMGFTYGKGLCRFAGAMLGACCQACIALAR
jgi:hypothetical protein